MKSTVAQATWEFESPALRHSFRKDARHPHAYYLAPIRVTVPVIVMDIGLPDRVDGLSLARSLRALPEPPPLIALSGYPKTGDTDGLFAVELLKPVLPDTVVETVHRVIHGRAAAGQAQR